MSEEQQKAVIPLFSLSLSLSLSGTTTTWCVCQEHCCVESSVNILNFVVVRVVVNSFVVGDRVKKKRESV